LMTASNGNSDLTTKSNLNIMVEKEVLFNEDGGDNESALSAVSLNGQDVVGKRKQSDEEAKLVIFDIPVTDVAADVLSLEKKVPAKAPASPLLNIRPSNLLSLRRPSTGSISSNSSGGGNGCSPDREVSPGGANKLVTLLGGGAKKMMSNMLTVPSISHGDEQSEQLEEDPDILVPASTEANQWKTDLSFEVAVAEVPVEGGKTIVHKGVQWR